MDPVVVSFLTVIGSAVAAYSGAYFKKRGEDQAITDGFAEVLRQTRETTEGTKAIETKISDRLWDRQKRWELRQDLLFDATREITRVRRTLLDLWQLQIESKRAKVGGNSPLVQKRDELWVNFIKAQDKFDEFAFVAEVICTQPVRDTLNTFSAEVHELAYEQEMSTDRLGALEDKWLSAIAAIRKELEIDNDSTV
jgi:hypothetical protein